MIGLDCPARNDVMVASYIHDHGRKRAARPQETRIMQISTNQGTNNRAIIIIIIIIIKRTRANPYLYAFAAHAPHQEAAEIGPLGRHKLDRRDAQLHVSVQPRADVLRMRLSAVTPQ
jgi:hypothetical protein